MEIPPELWAHGPEGLLGLVVFMIMRGDLATGRELRYWRKAFFAEQKMRQDLQRTGDLANSVLRALPQQRGEDP